MTNAALPPSTQARIITPEEFRELTRRPDPITTDELAAIDRLIAIAKRDTGQSRRVAGFLLAWWNAESCGGFDLTDLWAVDDEITSDMLAVIAAIARVRAYPDSAAPHLKADFEKLVRVWRPELVSGE